MKLENIHITGLYDRCDISWKLDSGMNILAGDNGSYKSTLLKSIYMFGRLVRPASYYAIKSARLSFGGGITVRYRRYNDSLGHLRSEAQTDDLLRTMAQKTIDDPANNGMTDDDIISTDILDVRRNGEKLSRSEFMQLCPIDYISTFDVPASADKGTDAGAARSALDDQLSQLESRYAYYLSDLSKQLTNRIMQKGSVEKNDVEEIFRDNNTFISIVNECFAQSGKYIDKESSRLQFILSGGDRLADNTHLSSGEKQLLVVLLTLLLQKRADSILLLDEPEISMHIDWQRRLLEDVQRINSNCQIILATHSPGLIMHGWESMVTNIQNLYSPTQK